MKKRSIAIVTAVIMLLTLVPATAFANKGENKATFSKKVEEKRFKKRIFIGKKNQANLIDEYREIALEMLDEAYQGSISDKSKYITKIWTEICDIYTQGRTVLANAKTIYELNDELELYTTYLDELGKLTKDKVKKASDIKKLKASYKEKIEKAYKRLKKSNYNTYYWDMILDARYMGKKKLDEATSFKDVAFAYSEAIALIKYGALTKSEVREYQEELQDSFTQYINIGLDAKTYDAATWAKIEKLYHETVAKLKKQQSEDGIIETAENAADEFFDITGIDVIFDYEEEGYYAYLDTLVEELKMTVDSYDESLYTDNGYDKILDIAYEAWDEMDFALTRKEAKTALDEAIRLMKKVPTKKQEIATFKKQQPQKLLAFNKKSSSVRLTWNKVKNADGYVVYRATKKDGSYKKIGRASKNRLYTAKNLSAGKTYYFKVRAYNKELETEDDITYYSKYSKSLKVRTLKK